MTDAKFFTLCAVGALLTVAYFVGAKAEREEAPQRAAMARALKAQEAAKIEKAEAERVARNKRCGMNAQGGITDIDVFQRCNVAAARARGEPDYDREVRREQIERDEYRRRFGSD
jgi:hypothetical protein